VVRVQGQERALKLKCTATPFGQERMAGAFGIAPCSKERPLIRLNTPLALRATTLHPWTVQLLTSCARLRWTRRRTRRHWAGRCWRWRRRWWGRRSADGEAPECPLDLCTRDCAVYKCVDLPPPLARGWKSYSRATADLLSTLYSCCSELVQD
jgi:hypothetical protein